MNYAEVIGHEITPATAAVLDRITAAVQHIHAEHPEITETVIWDSVLRIVAEKTLSVRNK